MASDFFYPPSKNAVQKTLSAQLLSTATTGDAITFADVDGLQNKPGVLVINRVDSNGDATPSSREYISYSGTSGNTVLIATRNVDSSASAKTHAVGSIVEFMPDVVWAQRIIDQFNIEHDIDGTHDKATAADIVAGTSDAKVITPLSLTYATTSTGWINPNETWTYASATTITVPAGAAAKYAVGDRIKLTQTTVKYFVIVTVADTLLTITGGTSYTLANAAITDNYYSHEATPVGYPQWFAYTPTWTSSGTAPAIGNGTISGRFTVTGRVCVAHFLVLMGASTTYGTGLYKFGLPITALNSNFQNGSGWLLDSGTNDYFAGSRFADNATQIYIMTSTPAQFVAQTVPFTWAVNDRIHFTLSYEV